MLQAQNLNEIIFFNTALLLVTDRDVVQHRTQAILDVHVVLKSAYYIMTICRLHGPLQPHFKHQLVTELVFI